jgi:hypothetical protein
MAKANAIGNQANCRHFEGPFRCHRWPRRVAIKIRKRAKRAEELFAKLVQRTAEQGQRESGDSALGYPQTHRDLCRRGLDPCVGRAAEKTDNCDNHPHKRKTEMPCGYRFDSSPNGPTPHRVHVIRPLTPRHASAFAVANLGTLLQLPPLWSGGNFPGFQLTGLQPRPDHARLRWMNGKRDALLQPRHTPRIAPFCSSSCRERNGIAACLALAAILGSGRPRERICQVILCGLSGRNVLWGRKGYLGHFTELDFGPPVQVQDRIASPRYWSA